MKPDTRVTTPKGVGVIDRVEDGQYVVRIPATNGWPFPSLHTFNRRDIKLLRDKKTVEQYGEATY
jgi:hypothetical protein